MDVQCVICDSIHTYDDDDIIVKRLKNRWIRTYLCPSCDERIRTNTEKRKATGKFKLYKEKKEAFLPDEKEEN